MECFDEAMVQADLMGYQQVHPEHLLIGVLNVPCATANWMVEEMWIETAAVHQEALASLSTWNEFNDGFLA